MVKRSKHPKPPHPPHELPPHLRNKKLDVKLLGVSIAIATAFCIVLGGLMAYANLGLNVILPVLAPVWVGGATLWYSTHSK